MEDILKNLIKIKVEVVKVVVDLEKVVEEVEEREEGEVNIIIIIKMENLVVEMEYMVDQGN